MKFLAVTSLLAVAASALPTLVEVAPRGSVQCEQKPRSVSIVIDKSGSNKDNDPNNLRLAAASKINAYLQGSDKIAVTQFDSVANTVYKLGAPGSAADSAIKGIGALGGTDVFLGLDAGIKQLASAHENAALVIFTDGVDDPPKPENKAKKLALLAKAKEQGVRVSWGHLSQSTTKTTQAKGGLISAIWGLITLGLGAQKPTTEIIPGPVIDADVSAAALATGGSVATLGDSTAYQKFVDAVLKNGLTNIDAACNDGNEIGESGGPINNNVTSYGLCSNNAAATFTYKAEKKEKLAVTISLVSKQNKVQLAATLENKATGEKNAVTVNSGSPSMVLTGSAEPGQDIVVNIKPSGASNDQCQYTVKLDAIPVALASSLSLPPAPSSTSQAPPPPSSSAPAPPPSSSAPAPPPSSSAPPPPPPSSSAPAPPPSSSAPVPPPSSQAPPAPSSSQAPPVPSSSQAPPAPSVTPSACPTVPAATQTITSTVIQTVTAPAPSATASVCICKCDTPGAKPMPKFEL